LSDGTLAALGWTDELEAAFTTYEERGFMPARVVAEHRGGYFVRSELGDRLAAARGRMRDDELWGGMPAVGDWVAVVDAPGDRFAIEALLPRRTKVSRKTPWLKAEEHILVANVDTVLLVAGLDQDFNPRRLERYLTAAWDSGSTPVIVVNKSDLAADPDAELVEVESIAIGVPVLAVSAATGEGLDVLEPHLRPGSTIALLGSSGVGKSTLVNRLAGREVLATAETSVGGRGRHTTSHRELVPLPSGALLLDTPGMRELQLWAGEEVLDTTFGEISELAAGCRFRDCAHEREPGCAIRRALGDGTLDQERWASYRKLQRELRALEIRKDARLRSEARKERARFARSQRKVRY
jgi:ribosome biogenesis GTPase